MTDFLDRISKLSPKRLALLALEQHEQIEAASRRAREPIAVVGIGCRFPGGGDNPAAYWQLLREGRDAIGEVPCDRWDIDALFDPDPDAPARMSVRSGGFLAGIGGFDPAFFGIAPREALSMDPQQRLLLEVTWEALEHAGIAAESLAGSATGVFVGICNSDHLNRLLNRGADTIDAYLASGNALSVASGRIAYCLGLQGPALSIDTSCSSSLVALHVACRSVRSGESRLAIAAGVNVMCSPEATIALSKAHMLAPDGRCKTFDASADGFSRGEGCGVLVLKRLEDALADGDRVLALIRGTAVNQDGRSGGLTVPNGPAQEAVIRMALADAGVQASDINYVEAHGTGTSLGDPIEVRALAGALGGGRTAANPLLIGSVKTNLGHLESAAGVAGIIKVVLALQHERIPPHLHFRVPSPHIAWADYPVKVEPQGAAWPRGQRRRLAGVSSFGFSGTNAHVVIEEAPVAQPAAALADRPLHCLPLSARSDSALAQLAGLYAEAFCAAEEGSFFDLVSTAGIGRSHLGERAAIVAGMAAEASAALHALHLGRPHPAIHRGTGVPGQAPEVVFLFTGQGSQYPGMSERLYAGSPVFREVIDQCDALLGPDAQGRTLKSILWAQGGDQSPIHETAWTQPALFAVEYGLAQLWRSWGIEPAAVIGHSVGEYVAACVAGVFTLAEGLQLIAERGRLMQSQCLGGTMAALFTSLADVAAAVAPMADRVAIAGINAQDSVVISGESEAVDEILEGFARREVRGQRLFISVAAHSPLVDPALDSMEACAARVTMRAPRVPVAWNLTGGKALPSGAAPDATYWRRHLREPVRFAEGISELYAQGFRTFLEVGPHPTLIALAQRSLPEDGMSFVSSLRRGKDDWAEMLAALAKLYVRGAQVDWAGVNRPYGGLRRTLPTYPFERRTYWLPTTAPTRAPPPARAGAHGDALGEERLATAAPQGGMFYQLAWEEAPAALSAAPLLTAPRSFAASLRDVFERLATTQGINIYSDLLPELDRLCTHHIVIALRKLGFDASLGRTFIASSEALRLGVLPRHSRLFTRMLDVLVEEGLLRRHGAGQSATLEIAGACTHCEPAHCYPPLLERFGAVDGELRTLRRCASELAAVLKGTQDPLQLLFPGGSLTEARQLYVESPFARTYNAALAQALEAAIAALPAGARLRVLEIGAGTGGTTTYVLPLLPADRVEYTYTDLSPLFLERAAEQFKQYPFIRYSRLDVARDPVTQDFQRGQYDIVIAANVLHATADLRRSVEHAHSLLASGGLLLLIEGVAPERWVDLTFGLTEGWWSFTDTLLRPDYPLIARDTWCDMLQQLGFTDVATFPNGQTLSRGTRQQALIVARAPAHRRPWALVGDQRAWGSALATHLRARGESVTLIDADALAAELPKFGELVYLGALEMVARDTDDADARHACQSLACELPLQWLARVAKQNSSLRTWLVTQGAQSVAGQMLPSARWQAPLLGLGRVFALEHPRNWGGLLDLPTQCTAADFAGTLLAAIDTGGSEDQIAWRDGKRFVARLLPSEAPANRPLQFFGDATYLITGGFGGLGLLVARWMVANGARHIALLGRNPDLGSQAVRDIEATGARIIALAGDVADEATLRAHLVCLVEQAPPLRGIVHAATDASVAPIVALGRKQIRAMLRPKIEGTVLLERLTRSLDLDFMVLFSSTAAVLGAAGFAHYAAANAFLDATAQSLNRPGRRVLSVNWGAWEAIRQASAETKRSFREAGLEPMAADDALRALGSILGGDRAQVMVAHINWNVLKPLHEARRVRPLLARLGNDLPDMPTSAGADTRGETAPALTTELASASEPRRREILVEFVRHEAAAVLGVEDRESVALDAGLFEMGMDSLMSVELRKRLERGAGRRLPSTLTFNYPSIAALSGFLQRELVVPEQPVAASAAPDAKPAPVGETTDDLDSLSDEQLEARLFARLEATR
jgi:acyl transferase domain-containing protein/cyclopropane fatty-acyl-phospholipid synthase-like methyltransferase/acyl carrier protein